MEALCELLREGGEELEQPGSWPQQQLDACGESGVYEWFMAPRWGGQDWSDRDIVAGYLELSSACLTTTFVITQRMGACRRIAASGRDDLAAELLPDLVAGRTFATVGISHLTTSRRHLQTPVLRAEETERGFVLDGYSPWCTGGAYADTIVLGATLDDGRQILVAAPMDTEGIEAEPAANLVGLTASQTGPVACRKAEVDRHFLLAGPVERVMEQGVGARTGGLQTSTLAAGLCRAACRLLDQEAERREDLRNAAAALQGETDALCERLLAAAAGEECSPQDLRQQANSLALRTAQAALAAAKGAGYVVGHPAGRWCREALFFLVWSCPQPVLSANLCELAGIQVD